MHICTLRGHIPVREPSNNALVYTLPSVQPLFSLPSQISRMRMPSFWPFCHESTSETDTLPMMRLGLCLLLAPAVALSKRGPNIKEYWEKI